MRKNREIKIIFILLAVFFLVFLALPMIMVLPMLLPTITYGFAIIYSFGNEGLLTKLFGRKLFDIYGFNGLLLGYVIYTLPISFMLIHNAMGYIDKRFMIVSRLMAAYSGACIGVRRGRCEGCADRDL